MGNVIIERPERSLKHNLVYPNAFEIVRANAAEQVAREMQNPSAADGCSR